MQGQRTGGRLRILWPWLVLALAMVPAIWYVLDYESDIDPDFPASSARPLTRIHRRRIALPNPATRSTTSPYTSPRRLW